MANPGKGPESDIKLHTGNRMPVLGLGTWELTKDTAGAVEHALKSGYRMIDTSGDYGTEPGIAEAIKKSGVNRLDIFIVAKVEETGDAYEAAKKNATDLETEYVNLLLIHRPPPNGAGEDLWRGLIRAKKEGIARDIGVSNYSVKLIKELTETTGEKPVVNQIEWTPFGHSESMLAYAKDNGIIIQAYSPLTRAERLDDEVLADLAEKYGKTPAQILIRWNLQLGTVPLPKANSKKHQDENMQVFDFVLSDGDMANLMRLNQHYSTLGKKLKYI